MRLLVASLVFAVATPSGFVSKADSPQSFTFTKLERHPEEKAAKPRCAKKIALGPNGSETACLMRKRKGAASTETAAPARQGEMRGREHHER